MRLNQEISLMIKGFFRIPNERVKPDDPDYFIDIAGFEGLVDEKINEFVKPIAKIICEYPNNFLKELKDYLVNLGKERDFTRGVSNNTIPLDDYLIDCIKNIKESSPRVKICAPLSGFFETINFDETEDKIKKKYEYREEHVTDKAAIYQCLKNFCESDNEEFNNHIDSKIKELIG